MNNDVFYLDGYKVTFLNDNMATRTVMNLLCVKEEKKNDCGMFSPCAITTSEKLAEEIKNFYTSAFKKKKYKICWIEIDVKNRGRLKDILARNLYGNDFDTDTVQGLYEDDELKALIADKEVARLAEKDKKYECIPVSVKFDIFGLYSTNTGRQIKR